MYVDPFGISFLVACQFHEKFCILCIQNCFCDVSTVSFINHVTNVLPEVVPFYKSGHKCLRVRPIGLADVCYHIISKAILSVIKPDIENVAGCSQLCASQHSGCDVAIHCIKSMFESKDTEAPLSLMFLIL